MKPVLVYVAFVFFIVMALIVVHSSSCTNKWEDSFEVRWGLMRGCQIKANGKWIPAENYREVK